MSDALNRRHGLEPFVDAFGATEAHDLSLSVAENLGFIDLRLGGDRAKELANEVLGQSLPDDANRFTAADYRLYWLAPDQTLIVLPADEAIEQSERLDQALSSQHAAVNDVSGGYVSMRLSGYDARTVLAKGCTVDLHPKAFGSGQCAQTGLAKAGVLIGCLHDSSDFELIVRRSFSEYLCRWLVHSAREQGVRLTRG